MGEAVPIINQVAASGQCDPLNQVVARPDINVVDQWRAVQACFQAGTVPARWQPQIAQILQSGRTPATAQGRLASAEAQLSSLVQQAQVLDAEIAAAEQRTRGAAEKLEMLTFLPGFHFSTSWGSSTFPRR